MSPAWKYGSIGGETHSAIVSPMIFLGLPAGLGKGEQLLVKEGDWGRSKTVRVDHAQWRILNTELAPEAVMMRARGCIECLGAAPQGICRDLLGRQDRKRERRGAAPDWHICEIDNLARQIAEAPEPLKEATVFGHRPSRHPCDFADIFDQGCLPKRFLLRVPPPLLIPSAAKLLLPPLDPSLQVGWVNGPQGQVVEITGDAILPTSVVQCLPQASRRSGTEDDVKSGQCHS
jgi:hypothetical protein